MVRDSDKNVSKYGKVSHQRVWSATHLRKIELAIAFFFEVS